MSDIRRRDVLAALLTAFLASALLALPQFDRLRGLSIDVLTWLRWTTIGRLYDPANSPAVVVALDEETYKTKPFEGTPNVTWTREIGRVITAIIDGAAKVVGLDLIFPTSIEQSEIPFGEETLGARVRGFDRDFLRTLVSASRADKLVLGQVQHQEHPIRPSPGQRAAVGQQRNIRPLNFHSDRDDIVRRIPLGFTVDGQTTPSMALELAARALGTTPAIGIDGSTMLLDYRIPAGAGNALTLNFDGGADDIPTYSLADLRACVEAGNADFFRRNFGGRIVLFGTVLDVEDRKLTSKRLATGIEGSRAERCVLPPPASTGKFVRDTVSGVYIHGTAVNNLIRRDPLIELGPWWDWTTSFAFAAFTALIALATGPLHAFAIATVAAGLWATSVTFAFMHALVLPLMDPLLSGVLALGATVGYRFVVADKDKRLLRKSFALYLAPAVIERLLASHKQPELGGESRTVTVFFSDIANFSSLAEKMTASELVTLMNEYLSAMTDIIESRGGFVDKYIGDAIVAVFGAPLDDPDHALHAVRAALDCNAKLGEMNRTAVAAFKGCTLSHRIGLNSGEALVGNIGSRRRFNYTAMGDAVNLAARLEGANKYYGTTIMASQTTMALAGPAITWRELDTIRVAGREKPVTVFEPVCEAGAESLEQRATLEAYANGLAHWRARDFKGAGAAFALLADRDPPAAFLGERAKRFDASPPPPGWQPINRFDGK
jgi:adenylate cyclase